MNSKQRFVMAGTEGAIRVGHFASQISSAYLHCNHTMEKRLPESKSLEGRHPRVGHIVGRERQSQRARVPSGLRFDGYRFSRSPIQSVRT